MAAADGRVTARPRNPPSGTQPQRVKASTGPSAHGCHWQRETQPHTHTCMQKHRLTWHWLRWIGRFRRSRSCASTQSSKRIQPHRVKASKDCSAPQQPLATPNTHTHTHTHTHTCKNVDSRGTGCVGLTAADRRGTARARNHPSMRDTAAECQVIKRPCNYPAATRKTHPLSRALTHTRALHTYIQKRRLTCHLLC